MPSFCLLATFLKTICLIYHCSTVFCVCVCVCVCVCMRSCVLSHWLTDESHTSSVPKESQTESIATCNLSRRHVFRWSAKERVWKRTAKGRRRKGKNREINEGDERRVEEKRRKTHSLFFHTQSRWSPASFRESYTHTHLSQRSRTIN